MAPRDQGSALGRQGYQSADQEPAHDRYQHRGRLHRAGQSPVRINGALWAAERSGEQQGEQHRPCRPDSQFLGLAVGLAAAAQPGADGRSDGVPSPHPASTGGEAMDNWPSGGAADAPPSRERGATSAPTGWNRRSHGCSGCTRTIYGTIRGTVRRLPARECGGARSGRVLQRACRDVLLRARSVLAADRPSARPGLVGRWGPADRPCGICGLLSLWPLGQCRTGRVIPSVGGVPELPALPTPPQHHKSRRRGSPGVWKER
jgi:hypothetical protein